MNLVVGRAGYDFLDNEIAAHFHRDGVDPSLVAHLNPADEIAQFDLLNGVTLFLDHVIRLEGVDPAESRRALEDGVFRLKQMPVWEASAWAPFELTTAGMLDDDPTFFVGSASGLLRELSDIAGRSPLSLSTPPQPYQRMREDFTTFVRSSTPLDLSEDEIIRWVWCSLRDGAEIAIREHAVLCGAPA
jgi:hypothetical protein